MMDLLSKKTNSGDLYVNLAERHLECHEWGQAIMAIEKVFFTLVKIKGAWLMINKTFIAESEAKKYSSP